MAQEQLQAEIRCRGREGSGFRGVGRVLMLFDMLALIVVALVAAVKIAW